MRWSTCPSTSPASLARLTRCARRALAGTADGARRASPMVARSRTRASNPRASDAVRIARTPVWNWRRARHDAPRDVRGADCATRCPPFDARAARRRAAGDVITRTCERRDRQADCGRRSGDHEPEWRPVHVEEAMLGDASTSSTRPRRSPAGAKPD